jgi:hypothetical protein
MVNLEDFLEKNPRNRGVGNFVNLEIIKNKLPLDLYDFLVQEQKATYGNNFLWTVSPFDWHEILNNWGLDGKNSYAFLRSSFGCLAFFCKDTYYALNVHEGSCNSLSSNNFDLLFNLVLCNSTNLKGAFCYDLHINNIDNLPILNEDEMYTLVPAIPLGGSFETSKIEVVKMNVQLDILAQLYNHQTTK